MLNAKLGRSFVALLLKMTEKVCHSERKRRILKIKCECVALHIDEVNISFP